MKPVCAILPCLMFSLLSGAQTAPIAAAKPTPRDSLPIVTINFSPVGNALAISPEDAFIGYPFCSSNGTTFLDVVHHPGFESQTLVGISPKAELSTYRIGAALGLVNATVLSVDATSSDVYTLVTAEKLDVLRKHDLDPASADAKTASEYYGSFVLRFASELASPDEIAIDLPFQPLRLAVTSRDTMMILGFDSVNQSPVLAVIDHEGQLVREIDANNSFGSAEQIAAGAPQSLKNQSMPDSSAELATVLSAAQWVHYGDSLLLLMPGSHAKVITLHSNGEIEDTRLHLPEGFEALSLVSSDSKWFVRVTEGTATGNLMNKTILVMANPADGSILQIIRTPQISPINISCVVDGKYYAIHWNGEKENMKAFLMAGTQ
jgi:hypothetical protein